jgi:hypothetical protein
VVRIICDARERSGIPKEREALGANWKLILMEMWLCSIQVMDYLYRQAKKINTRAKLSQKL